jgi:hypothetical protein
VIADGATTGLLHVADVELAASCVGAAMPLLHPQRLAQFNHTRNATLDDMITFIIADMTPCQTQSVERTKAALRRSVSARRETKRLASPRNIASLKI